MAEYSLTAEALLSFGRNPPPNERAFARWALFADKVGQAIFPFIIRPDRLGDVPFRALGMTPVKLSDMVPQPGEMWVLFCFKDSFRDTVSPDSPLRTDGFPLILEWRRGQPDSELLSSAFHDLADRVREQFGEDGKEWGLHPAFDRYGDAIAFTDSNLFSEAENSLQIASAWGALAAGLHCCIEKKFPGEWPFPSIQWDWEHKKTSGVAGIAEKLSVAVDCGAETVAVAAEQMKDAGRILRNLKKGKDAGKFRNLRLYAARDGTTVGAIVDDIAWGALRKKRNRRILNVINLLVVLMLSGLFVWQHKEKNVAIRRQQINDLRIMSMSREFQDSDLESIFNDFNVIRSAFDLPEAQSLFRRQLSLRNWLVPIDVCSLEDSLTDFSNSCLRCEIQELKSGNARVSCRQFWIPFGFPVSYVHHGISLEARDAETHETLWRRPFYKEEKDESQETTLQRPVSVIESWRVNPSGLIGIAEVTTLTSSTNSATVNVIKHEMVARDPFSGRDLWRVEVPSEITAFSFSNNGDRFAFALSDGCSYVKECDTGTSVALPKRFGFPVQAMVFSDDDSILHVQVNGKDVSLSIVWQIPVDESGGENLAAVNKESGCCDELFSLLMDVGIPDADKIDNCRKALGYSGVFMRYSLLHPSSRTINVNSSLSISNKVEALSNGTKTDCKAALKLLPDACRPLTEWWIIVASEMARRNLADKLKCPLTDNRLVAVHFEDDSQATWYGEHMLRYALQQHPADVKTKEKADRIFLKRTGRMAIPPIKKGMCPQMESDRKRKELWRKIGYVLFQRDKHVNYRTEIDFTRKRNDDAFAPQVDDGAAELWGKMLRLMDKGTEEGAIRCLEAYARVPVSVDDEGEREKFVPAVRQFIKERKKRDIKGGFVVMRYKPPATSHATFDIGDIVIAVNGIRDVSDDDFIRMERECNENCELEILRYNPSTKTFDELKVPLAKGECPVMTRNLAESK